MGHAEEVRERSDVTYMEPPLYNVDRAFWVAEDPDSGCMGLGQVEAEAIGNLIAVVREYEDDGGAGTPYVKVPGDTVEKSWDRSEDRDEGGLFGRLRGLLDR
jgi:hypothetical protein